jgi:hypothetical protein
MLIRLNGHLQFFHNDLKIKRVKQGVYEVIRNGLTYHVEGGRSRGGKHTDWFVECPGTWDGPIWTSGLVDSLKLIDGA